MATCGRCIVLRRKVGVGVVRFPAPTASDGPRPCRDLSKPSGLGRGVVRASRDESACSGFSVVSSIFDGAEASDIGGEGGVGASEGVDRAFVDAVVADLADDGD